MRFLCLFVVFLALSVRVLSADTAYVVVADFRIEGAVKTKARVLKRDLTFGIGDTLWAADVAQTLELNRLRLMNLGIFRQANITLLPAPTGGQSVVVVLKVVESWYIYPYPIFELADRNFNVWWTDSERDWRRTNYGLRLLYNNLSGHNDPLGVLLQGGYTPKVTLSYQVPLLGRSQRLGLSTYLFYAQNREIGYKTLENRLVFTPDLDRNLLQRWNGYMALSYRPQLLGTHTLAMGYSLQQIDTAIAGRYNPDYFLNGQSRQQYVWLYYQWAHDNRDNRPYPTQGHLAQFYASKLGLLPADNVNTWDIYLKWAQYWAFNRRWSLENVAKGRTNLVRQAQPYNLQRALGYGTDFIRGYEYYVVDGTDFAYLKNTLRFLAWEKDLKWPSKFNIKVLSSFKTMPIRAYLTAHTDGGYVAHRAADMSNTFNNRWLMGWGVGVNVVVYYNVVWVLEYSRNTSTQKGGLFLSYRGSL